MTGRSLTWLQLRQLLRVPFFVETAVLAPLSFGVLRVLGIAGAQHRGEAVTVPALLWFEIAVAGLWASTTTAVGIIGLQRFQGTLEPLVMSPLPARRVFASLTTAASCVGLVAVPVGLGVQAATGTVPAVTPAVLAALALAVAACCASAACLAALFVISRHAVALEPLVLVPVWLLTGVVVPVTLLPAWAQTIAWAHPLTGAVALARSVAPGPSAEATAGLAVTELAGLPAPAVGAVYAAASLVTAAVWLALAAVLLRIALRRARVAGTLGLA